MRIAYFDCFSGVSGDMVLGALVDAGLDPDSLSEALSSLPLSGYDLTFERVMKNGIAATRARVSQSGHHHARHLKDILAIIDGSSIGDRVKQAAREIFTNIAAVEAGVHGTGIEEVHFHEIGAVDSIVDIVGACAALDLLGIEEVRCSRINVGEGTVKTAHGVLPVPAPATAALLKNIPIYSSGIPTELTTPTGAAIMAHFARSFGPLPEMRLSAAGYGAGMKDLPVPNLLRVFIGEEETRADRETIIAMETNIDDMNPEFYGHVIDRLLAAGALDAYITPVIMKKTRPGTLLTALAREDAAERIRDAIFSETTTGGIRYRAMERAVLGREIRRVMTRYGEIGVIRLTDRGRVVTLSPEYEECRRIALERGVPLKQVYEEAKKTALLAEEQ